MNEMLRRCVSLGRGLVASAVHSPRGRAGVRRQDGPAVLGPLSAGQVVFAAKEFWYMQGYRG